MRGQAKPGSNDIGERGCPKTHEVDPLCGEVDDEDLTGENEEDVEKARVECDGGRSEAEKGEVEDDRRGSSD